jgi:hypothetical protein
MMKENETYNEGAGAGGGRGVKSGMNEGGTVLLAGCAGIVRL